MGSCGKKTGLYCVCSVSINQFDFLSPERKNLGRGRKGDGTFSDHI